MGKIDSWITKLPRLKNSKVARFSYKAEAYANDDIEGVENYDYSRDMNIPSATHTDFDPDVLSTGARSNFSSIPKNGLNHFFGRVSYNLNKVIDFISDFLDDFIALNTSFISFTEIVSFSSSATLSNYADGTTKRLLNIAGSTITITLPVGETYLGSNTILLAPSIMLTITKRGTVWINSSNAIDDTQITKANTFSAEYINNKTQTLRYNANFTLPTFLDGTRVRLANTHATNTITCTLPTGQTMNEQSSFTITPDTLLEFELIGTSWKCVSNEAELIETVTATGIKSISLAQFRHVRLVLFVDTTATSAVEATYKIISEQTYYIYFTNFGDAKGIGLSVTTTSKTITSINYLQSAVYGLQKLEIYGMK